MDRNVDEEREEIRRQFEVEEGWREHDRAAREQLLRVREGISEATKMLRGDGPKGRGNG